MLGGASKCWGGAKHVGGCTNEVGGGGGAHPRTPPENPPVLISYFVVFMQQVLLSLEYCSERKL